MVSVDAGGAGRGAGARVGGEVVKMALTDKQTIFVNEYLISFNRTQAALAAGYSKKTAYSIGAALLKNPEIAEAVSQRLTEAAMSADEVLMRLAEQARGAHGKYLSAFGVDLGQLIADNKGHLVKSIKQNQYGKDIEFYDAQAALVHLGKHHKLFIDKTEVTGKDGGPVETAGSIAVRFIDYRAGIATATPTQE